jgi:hypothetical protein
LWDGGLSWRLVQSYPEIHHLPVDNNLTTPYFPI